MGNITDKPLWENVCRRIEPGDSVIGGDNAPINICLEHIANRTAYLKQQTEANKTAADSALSGKADKASTLAAYGITNGVVRHPQTGAGVDINTLTSDGIYPLYSNPIGWGMVIVQNIGGDCVQLVITHDNVQYLRYRNSGTWSQSRIAPTTAASATAAGIVKVIDSLASDDAASALSAAQGKALQDTVGAVARDTVPVGCVAHFAGTAAPPGWLRANGAAVSRAQYAALFAAIGMRYGVGDGRTTFNLPDLRGEFVRGWDDDRGVDAGRTLGSRQDDAIRTHSIVVPNSSQGGSNTGVYLYADKGGDANEPENILTYKGEAETRPRNIALLACIKY